MPSNLSVGKGVTHCRDQRVVRIRCHITKPRLSSGMLTQIERPVHSWLFHFGDEPSEIIEAAFAQCGKMKEPDTGSAQVERRHCGSNGPPRVCHMDDSGL